MSKNQQHVKKPTSKCQRQCEEKERLSVGMYVGSVTVESRMKVSQKNKNRTTI